MSRLSRNLSLFNTTKNFLEKKKNVSWWVDRISLAARKVSDRQLEMTFAAIALELYDRTLLIAQKSIADQAYE